MKLVKMPLTTSTLVIVFILNNPTTALAQTNLEKIIQRSRSLQPRNQGITQVHQLGDLSPSNWSYEALRSLVERYGCISRFRDRTDRGDRPLSRYEFAAGLNSCLEKIERSIERESIEKNDLSAGYLASPANEPTDEGGIFNAPYGAIATGNS